VDLREKVIKGNRTCQGQYSDHYCRECPYPMDVPSCIRELHRDTYCVLTAETVWVYSTDEEGKPKWNCKNCGKAVHKDPAEKLYCSRCGLRARKEA